MNAIRQIVEVKNHKLDIQLPENFDAEYAEVIIFPKVENIDFEISEEEKEILESEGFKFFVTNKITELHD